jgi:hypothetical protein
MRALFSLIDADDSGEADIDELCGWLRRSGKDPKFAALMGLMDAFDRCADCTG